MTGWEDVIDVQVKAQRDGRDITKIVITPETLTEWDDKMVPTTDTEDSRDIGTAQSFEIVVGEEEYAVAGDGTVYNL